MKWSGIVYAFSINSSAVSFHKLFDPCASITNHKMKKYNNMCHLLVYQGPPITLCTRAHLPVYQSPPTYVPKPTYLFTSAYLIVHQGPPNCVPEPTYLCTRVQIPVYQSSPNCVLEPIFVCMY